MVVGTLTGKAILKKIPKKTFTVAFEVVLAGIALYLIISG